MQVVRVRLIGSEKSSGCEEAPTEVLKELRKIESTQEFNFINVDSLNLEEIHVDLDNMEEAEHLIFENSKELFEKNRKVFFVGGDHSISFPIGEAFFKNEEDSLSVVFDAHGGCKQDLVEGWLRRLIEGGVNGRRIILISARNLTKKEADFIKKEEITLIKMDVFSENLVGICDLVMERARNSKGFFVNFDIDSIDPAYAPGTGELEHNGLNTREAVYFLKRLSLLSNFRGASIVNINPKLDMNGITVKLGAKLIAEMIYS